MVAAPLDDTTLTTIQANHFPIKTVKLFSSGSAEITRTFPLPFLRSQSDPQIVEIVHLPAGIQSADVSVISTSGNVTLLDHYQAKIANVTTSTSKNSNVFTFGSKLRELEKERVMLEDERRLRQQSFRLLSTYMDSLAQCKSQSQAEAANMISFFDEFVEIGHARASVVAELDEKLVDVNNRIQEETDRISQLHANLPLKVVAVLSCDSEVAAEAAELTLTYVVTQVSWKPEYDLHITIADNVPSSTVKLDFRCSVTQWTGENWDNVSLSLTTADQVSQLIQVPEAKRIDVSLVPTQGFQAPRSSFLFPAPSNSGAQTLFGGRAPEFGQAPRPSFFSAPSQSAGAQGLFGSTQALREPDRGNAFPLQGTTGAVGTETRQGLWNQPQQQLEQTSSVVPIWNQPPKNPPAGKISDAPTVSRIISQGSKDPITHIANGSIFIPSDRAAHHVLVSSLSLQAEFMRVAVPSVDTRVYYTCEVKNTSEYVLLPGTVKTQLNNKLVSSTEIQNTDLPQTLECCLAVDTSVKTIYSRPPDTMTSEGTFTTKTTTTYTSTTIVQNSYAEPIRGVVVRTSLPLPTDPRITIVLKEPAGLADIDEGNVILKESCLARWSTGGGRKGKEMGLFEWVCDVNPGTELLKAVWEVCTPKDWRLSEQIRGL